MQVLDILREVFLDPELGEHASLQLPVTSNSAAARCLTSVAFNWQGLTGCLLAAAAELRAVQHEAEQPYFASDDEVSSRLACLHILVSCLGFCLGCTVWSVLAYPASSGTKPDAMPPCCRKRMWPLVLAYLQGQAARSRAAPSAKYRVSTCLHCSLCPAHELLNAPANSSCASRHKQPAAL